jgi:hypothetical protein
MPRRFAVVAALATVVVTTAAGADVTTAVPDRSGDAVGVAADITNGSITQDAGGTLAFGFTLANRSALTADDELQLFLDTDANPSTGEDGDEYILWSQAGQTPQAQRWTGSSWQRTGLPSLAGTGTTIRVHPRDLGNTRRLIAYFQTVAYSDESAYDLAGPLPLALQAATPALTAQPLQLTPTVPRARGQLHVSTVVQRQDTGALVSSGTVRCSATIAGKPVTTTRPGHFITLKANGQITTANAACGWHVPASTAGKLIRGRITIQAGGLTIARSFAARIR